MEQGLGNYWVGPPFCEVKLNPDTAFFSHYDSDKFAGIAHHFQ
jgi:hypothetical protein